MSYRWNCVVGRIGWRRPGQRSRVWRQRLRAADDASGRQPGQDRNPKGGPPYKRAYGEPDPTAQSNFADPESGIMKISNDGFQQCYNAQMAVDGDDQLVVATALTANASDQGDVPVLLNAVAETLDEQPGTVLADAGYCNERDLAELKTRGIDAYVSPGREIKTASARDPEQYLATTRMVKKLSTSAGRAAVRRAQVVVGGAVRLDQACAGTSALQPVASGQGAVQVGLGVLGVERQAPPLAGGGVGGEACSWYDDRAPIRLRTHDRIGLTLRCSRRQHNYRPTFRVVM